MIGNDALAKVALDAVARKVLVHNRREGGVIIGGQGSGRDIEQAHLLTAALGSLGDLHANVARANHRDGAHGFIAHPAIDFLTLLEELEEADALKVAAGQLGRDGQRTGGQDELVIALVKAGAVRLLAMHHMVGEIDGGNAGLKVDASALGLEGLLIGVEQVLVRIDLTADPQGGAATQVAKVGIAVDHDHLLVLVVVQQRIGGRDTSVVGADDDGLHRSAPPHNANIKARQRMRRRLARAKFTLGNEPA